MVDCLMADRLAAPSRRPARRLMRLLRDQWLGVAALVAVAGLVLAVDPRKLVGVLSGVDPRVLLAMAPCVILVYVLRALAWQGLLARAGIRATTRAAIAATFAGQALIFLPGGDLARAGLLEHDPADGRSTADLMGTLVFDNVLYAALVTIAMAPVLLVLPQLTGVVAAAAAVEVAAILFFAWPQGYAWAVSLVTRLPGLRRYVEGFHVIGPTFRLLLHPATVLRAAVFDGAAVLTSLFLFELALHAVRVTHLSLAKAAFAFAAGHILSGATLLPAGLGAYEAILTGFLATQGIAPPTGAAAALLYRGFNDVLMALVGLFVGVAIRRRTGLRMHLADIHEQLDAISHDRG